MRDDFQGGIRLGENEDNYKSALREYRGGYALNLNPRRRGHFVVHRVGCLTISYDLERAGHSRRSGKIFFRDRAELDTWYKDNHWVGVLKYYCNECP
jgi:hypothetical protein